MDFNDHKINLKPYSSLAVIVVKWIQSYGHLFYYVDPKTLIGNKVVNVLYSTSDKEKGKPIENAPPIKPSMENMRRERAKRRMSLERSPKLDELKKMKP